MKIEKQINNLQNSNIGATAVDNTGAQIGLQIIQLIIDFKFIKTDRYDIDNLSKKNIEIPEENQIKVFDIAKIRNNFSILLNIHILFTLCIYISTILIIIMISINFLSFYANNFIILSIILFSISYFSLFIKSKNKKYTQALISVNFENLIMMKTTNSKMTNFKFLPSIYYLANHIVEPYYNYYAYVILINEEKNETYLYFKEKEQYKDFKSLITRFYSSESITD